MIYSFERDAREKGRRHRQSFKVKLLDSVHDDTLRLMNNKKDNKSISFPVVLDHAVLCRVRMVPPSSRVAWRYGGTRCTERSLGDGQTN